MNQTSSSPEPQGILRLIESKLVPAFINAQQFQRIACLSAELPALHIAGFEYPLGNDKQGLDFQQAIELTPSLIAKLSKQVHLMNRYPGLLRVCQEMMNRYSEATGLLDQLWLEFDLVNNAASKRDPVYFVGFNKLLLESACQNDAITSSHQLLTGESMEHAQSQYLHELTASFPENTGVSHLGIMRSRGGSAIRLVIPTCDAQSMLNILAAVPWSGDFAATESLGRYLFESFSEVRLCLDVEKTISSRIGLECLFSKTRLQHNGIASAVELLRTANYCTSAEANKLLSWPARVVPGQLGDSWPDELMLESITHPENQFSVVDCRLSHLKFASSPGTSTEAKAYFGFRHQIISV
jgi:hypothetical protein